MTGNLLSELVTRPPGSLTIGGGEQRLADWVRAPGGTEDRFELTEPASGIAARVAITRYPGVPAVEYALHLRNDARSSSPVLSRLRALDVHLDLSAEATATVCTINGSLGQLDDFLPWTRTVAIGDSIHLEPTGGRSSDGAMPFFTVGADDRSYAVGIGWSGQWVADIDRNSGGLRLQAGLADAKLWLQPREEITLPSIVIAAANGDTAAADNAIRRVLADHYLPRSPEGTAVTPMAHMTMSTYHLTQEVSELSELGAVAATADLDLEAFWVDACWYGASPVWWEQVGNWYVREADFPQGLRPIGDAAHKRDLRFVLWFEPERARADSQLAREHPDWFLSFPPASDGDAPSDHASQYLLLDLGNPAARQAILELTSTHLRDAGADVYRQDFNTRPLDAWRAADGPGRRGIHEIRHVEGLYWLWDRLRERHPGLVIDNCASGGRRIDVETLRRSVPLWRSDSADVGGGATGDGVTLANQVQVSGLSRYVAQHTGPIWAFDPYHVRSGISPGFVVYCPLPVEPAEQANLRAATAEIRRLRPLLAGDFYSLLDVTVDQDSWSASQFHRREARDGCAVILRRPGSDVVASRIALRAVEPRTLYRVTMSSSYAIGPAEEFTGAELAELGISIPSAPGSVLVEYEPIGRT